jgi:hypothetical protein
MPHRVPFRGRCQQGRERYYIRDVGATSARGPEAIALDGEDPRRTRCSLLSRLRAPPRIASQDRAKISA